MSAFLKIDQQMYEAACVYRSEAPDPLPPPLVTHCMNTCTPVLIHTGKGEGVDEPVRRLEWR